MSRFHPLRVLLTVLLGLATTASAVYLFVYLFRWEWNRAIISASLLTLSTIGLAAALITSRLAAIEARLGQMEKGLTARDVTPSVPLPEIIAAANADHATRHFAWLARETQRTSVFVPLLIGAGILLSGLAYAVERVAGWFARIGVDRTAVSAMAINLPLGPVTVAAARGPQGNPSWRGTARVLLPVIVVLLTLIMLMREQTMTVDSPAVPVPSTFEISVAQQRAPRPLDEVSEALWAVCRLQLPSQVSRTSTTVTPDGFRLTLDHSLGTFEERRFVGCLSDVRFDYIVTSGRLV